MKQSFLDGFPVEAARLYADPTAVHFGRTMLRNAAELESDGNATIVAHAQEVLQPQFISEILEPAQDTYNTFTSLLRKESARMRFTETGPAAYWVFQRRAPLATGRDHIIQTCIEVAAPYAALDEGITADLPAAERLVATGEQPDHDILGVQRKARLGLGKLFGFKPYEQETLANTLADQLLSAEKSQFSIYTAVDHGDGLQPQTLGRFRFNHAQHLARKMQYLDPRNGGRLAQDILAADHELSASGAEAYLRDHIGWSVPSDYDHLNKVAQIVSESTPIADNSQCIAPIFAYTAYAQAA